MIRRKENCSTPRLAGTFKQIWAISSIFRTVSKSCSNSFSNGFSSIRTSLSWRSKMRRSIFKIFLNTKKHLKIKTIIFLIKAKIAETKNLWWGQQRTFAECLRQLAKEPAKSPQKARNELVKNSQTNRKEMNSQNNLQLVHAAQEVQEFVTERSEQDARAQLAEASELASPSVHTIKITNERRSKRFLSLSTFFYLSVLE